MKLAIEDAYSKLIAIHCSDSETSQCGSGTAFWLSLGQRIKLVTAAHIPRLESYCQSAKHWVTWSMTEGRAGGGSACIRAIPNVPDIDYAWIEFDDSSQAPPGREDPFYRSAQCPSINEDIVAMGFPGAFVAASPLPSHAPGKVLLMQESPNSKISIAGSACGGYSGGPAFRLVEVGFIDDRVIGLMCGAPTPETNLSLGESETFILEGANSFV